MAARMSFSWRFLGSLQVCHRGQIARFRFRIRQFVCVQILEVETPSRNTTDLLLRSINGFLCRITGTFLVTDVVAISWLLDGSPALASIAPSNTHIASEEVAIAVEDSLGPLLLFCIRTL